MKERLGIAALTFAVVAVVLGVVSIALAWSLPYRIGPGEYGRFVWSVRLFWPTMLLPLVAIFLGVASRQRLPITLAMLSWFLLLFCVPNSVNSRPNPQAWCNNNLRKIESAKYQIAAENLLTNGTVIPGGRLSKYLDGGFDSLECVKHGNYTVNAIGIEPRCSVHGSMSEMEAGWKKGIH